MKKSLSVILAFIMLLCVLPYPVQAADTELPSTGKYPISTARWEGTNVVWQKISGVDSYALTVSSRVVDGVHDSVIESDMYIELNGTQVYLNRRSGKYINVTYNKDTAYFTADVGSAINIYPNDLYHFVLTGYVGSSGVYDASSGEVRGSVLLSGADLKTFTFLPGGGSGSMEPQKQYTNSSFRIPECTFTPPMHKEFVNWKCSNGEFYNPGKFITVTDDLTFTAQWKDKTWIAYANCILDAPVAGQTPDMTPTAGLPDAYQATLDYWYLWDFDSGYPHLTSSSTFVAGKKYAVRVKFTAKSGYYFDNNTEFQINGANASYIGGNEYQYIFTAVEPTETTYSLYGVVTSYLDDNEDVTFRLRKSGSWAASHSITFTGNEVPYTISGVKPGNYTYTVTKKNHVTRTGTVSIKNDMILNVKICPIGDADNNGRVNAADAKAAFQHGNEQKLIEDDYKFKCADVVSPESRVNAADAKAIFRHANEQKSLWTD